MNSMLRIAPTPIHNHPSLPTARAAEALNAFCPSVTGADTVFRSADRAFTVRLARDRQREDLRTDGAPVRLSRVVLRYQLTAGRRGPWIVPDRRVLELGRLPSRGALPSEEPLRLYCAVYASADAALADIVLGALLAPYEASELWIHPRRGPREWFAFVPFSPSYQPLLFSRTGEADTLQRLGRWLSQLQRRRDRRIALGRDVVEPHGKHWGKNMEGWTK